VVAVKEFFVARRLDEKTYTAVQSIYYPGFTIGVARSKPTGPQSQVQSSADTITACEETPVLPPRPIGSMTLFVNNSSNAALAGCVSISENAPW
jgi:hypothetical protein